MLSKSIVTFVRFVFADLAAIRKLLEEGDGDETCPSCGMPFDKGKKRKLIDSCGHERCYSCMFRNEGCQLCAAPVEDENDSSTKGNDCAKFLILLGPNSRKSQQMRCTLCVYSFERIIFLKFILLPHQRNPR